MNLSLINAYFQVTEGEKNTRKYATRLAERWAQLYPVKVFTGKHLVAQVKNIKTRKLLSPDELDALRAEVLAQSPTARLRSIRRSIQGSATPPRRVLEPVEEEEIQGTSEPETEQPALEIREIFEEISLKWEGISLNRRPKISRIKLSTEAKKIMRTINAAVREPINRSTGFEELCHRVYCAAIVANLILQTKPKQENQGKQTQKKPPWEERLEKRIATIRREIGIIHLTLNNGKISRKTNKKLRTFTQKINLKETDKQYKIKLQSHVEKLKQKIAALGNRLRRYHKRTQRFQQNNLFTNNQRMFFRTINTQKDMKATQPPSPDTMKQYWSSFGRQR
ncbi:uncharacterized protein LOC123311019 [Coccinella septempunctata]|uniref:uncharacterized protein LOC123311019 n=1 Tax=Coccinella septempunctata TaxID=41139 RepID=UPI001D07E531|nr:uncharacterized protein LOC123311019 [Coccinella septempunctata]